MPREAGRKARDAGRKCHYFAPAAPFAACLKPAAYVVDLPHSPADDEVKRLLDWFNPGEKHVLQNFYCKEHGEAHPGHKERIEDWFARQGLPLP